MPPFELSIPRLQYMSGRVHNARVNVPELLQFEEICRVLSVLENVGRGTIDRDPSRRLMGGEEESVSSRDINT